MCKPECRKCGSTNLTIVSAGLSCLDCAFHASRIVPTEDYAESSFVQVDFDGVPATRQRSRNIAGKAINAFMRGVKAPADTFQRTKPGKGSEDCEGQTSLFNEDELQACKINTLLF